MDNNVTGISKVSLVLLELQVAGCSVCRARDEVCVQLNGSGIGIDCTSVALCSVHGITLVLQEHRLSFCHAQAVI